MKWPDAEGLAVEELTVPSDASTALREVWSRALRRCVLDLLQLQPLAHAATWASMRSRLFALLRSSPGALFSVLRQPGIGTRIRCLRDPNRTDIDRGAVFETLLAAIAHELGGLWGSEKPPCSRGFTSWRQRGRVHDGTLVTADGDGPLFVNVGADVVLCRADDSPIALHEAHPEKDGNRTSLGGQPQSRWVETLEAALELIRIGLPALHAEIRIALQQVVPVGFHEEQHLSASFRENLGTAYLSLHPNPLTMAEAIVHEFSHNKLNALFELDPVLHNAFQPLFTSPVRPDPRPLHGVLLAVHAFVAVGSLYRSLRSRDHAVSRSREFSARFDTIVQGNAEGLETLEYAEPTGSGEQLLRGIRMSHAALSK